MVHALVLPPLPLFLVIAAGLLLARKRRRLGIWIASVGGGLLVLLTIPLVGAGLLCSLQWYPALPVERAPGAADAIVVLGADTEPWAPEYDGRGIGPFTLERVRYAAYLHDRTKLPVLTTGGLLEPDAPALATLMRDVLQEEFGVPVRWSETEAWNTFENARRSSQLLRADGIERVLLVTHAWHMPRALACFEANGLAVVPAPMSFRPRPRPQLGDFLPSAKGLRQSTLALHEWIGLAWYHVRYLSSR